MPVFVLDRNYRLQTASNFQGQGFSPPLAAEKWWSRNILTFTAFKIIRRLSLTVLAGWKTTETTPLTAKQPIQSDYSLF